LRAAVITVRRLRFYRADSIARSHFVEM
jgi:hypothetical protein